MIQELITYFKTNCSKEAKTFGHLYESIALENREKRCRIYWQEHINHCKNFIVESSQHCRKKNAVLVLGSGPLHEIPIEVLNHSFKRVDLIDIVHLPATLKKYSHLKNCSFISADITELETLISESKKPFNKIPSQFLDGNYDFVISANLLSQIPHHLKNYLFKKASPPLSEIELEEFASSVSRDHFLYLKKFSCPVVLITDIKTVFLDKKDKIMNEETPPFNFTLPKAKSEWWWNIAPIPEFHKEIALKMKVAAFIFNS